MNVFLDPADSERQRNLEVGSGIYLSISDKSFGGGVLIKIPSKNILIDNTFNTALKIKRQEYTFLTGGSLDE